MEFSLHILLTNILYWVTTFIVIWFVIDAVEEAIKPITNWISKKIKKLGAKIMKQNELKKYVKIDGKTVGLVIAVRQENHVFVSWSACKDGDTFDKGMANRIAHGRVGHQSKTIIPEHIAPSVAKMFNRAHSFFPGCTVSIEGVVVEDRKAYYREQRATALAARINNLQAEIDRLKARQ